MKKYAAALALACALILSACSGHPAKQTCTVIFEDDPRISFVKQVYDVERFHGLSVTIGIPRGCRICDVNYPGYDISAKSGENEKYDYYTLTLPQLRYSTRIRLDIAPAYETVYLTEPEMRIQESSPHLFQNTLPYSPEYLKPGLLPIGWRTRQGTYIPFGSRLDRRSETTLELTPEYLPATEESCFTWEETPEGAVITGFSGGDRLVIPWCLGGREVVGIAPGAFGDLHLSVCALCPTLRCIAPGAFGNLEAEVFYLFDNLEALEESAFQSYSIKTLYVLASRAPVYSGSYFDTFPDKLDYLQSLSGEKKLLLFSGSSARFGYDSPTLEAAFPEYRVVNLGVFAYTNMRPLAQIILPMTDFGDILLSSPELDAIDTQFCGSTRLDKELFAMTESDYARLSALDFREYTGLFEAYSRFNQSRAYMTPRSYQVSSWDYDEDGAPVQTKSYNRQGDYILYRENNYQKQRFGVKRAFFTAEAISPADLQGLNQVYDAFSARGVRVFYTYSPRSAISISENSTPEQIAALDDFLAANLHAPVISHAQDALLDPLYFFGTDNHLSTEGVKLHTQTVIRDLHQALDAREVQP